MGQRFQTVFILPKVYMNEDNPNNREKKVLICHNQWLFGFSALKVNLNILRRLRRHIKNRSVYGEYAKSKKDFKNNHLERVINEDVLKYAVVKEFPPKNSFNPSNEFLFYGFENLGEELTREDNNNGFFICEITEDLKIKYAFISGLEDTEKYFILDPKTYLKLFYSEQEINNADNLKEVEKVIKGYSKFEGMVLYKAEDLKKGLNKNLLKQEATQ